MKRVTWFVGGVAAGAAGAEYARRTVRRVSAQLAPRNVANGAVQRVRRRGADLADAVREGRTAMRVREAELRARRDGRVDTLEGAVGPGDQLLVDGEPVDTARVIVLRRAK